MRIALVHRTFSTQGGTERFGFDLARCLRDVGDEVHLFGRTFEPFIQGIHFHPVPLPPGGPPGGRTIKLLSFLAASSRALRQTAQEEGAPFDAILGLGKTLEQDVLRVGGGCHAAYLEAVEGWCPTDAAASRSVHSPASDVLAGMPISPPSFSPQLYNRLVLGLERRQMCSGRTRHVIAVSHRVRSELLSRYNMPESSIHVVHNGVDLKRFSPKRFTGLRSTLRAQLGIAQQARVLLFVGNGLVRKGYGTVLTAFTRFTLEARARSSASPLCLLVVSNDALRRTHLVRPYLRALTGLNASIRVVANRAEIENLYAISDMLVLPSRYEPFGNVCLEAMAMGLPVVTTRVNGVSEILTGELSGLTMENAGDGDVLVFRMMILLDVDRMARLGANARELALSLPMEKNAREIRAVLQAVR